MPTSKAPQATRLIGPAGTIARACLGLALTAGAVLVKGASWWDLLGALLVLPAVAVAAATVVNRMLAGTTTGAQARRPWSLAQMVAAAGIIVFVLAVGTAITFVSPVDGVSLAIFIGVSMLVASLRGFDGCEILALPNLVMANKDAIWCPLYSSLDGVERPRDAAPQ